jgi:hypothetical protein
MLRSVQRLERRGGLRPRLFDNRSSREYLEYQAIARVQGTEVQAPAPVILNDAHERLEGLLRRGPPAGAAPRVVLPPGITASRGG